MRYLTSFIKKDLKKKMVFLSGPRQCGKTTLAKNLLQSVSGRYFNWDYDIHRQDLIAKKWSDTDRLLVFDEIHKHPRWKNWVKGIYDVQKEQHQFLITGSARLNIYKKGGDSLLGRYFYWRLHPFTLSEIPKGITKQEAFDRLMRVGGFPEPFLDNNEQYANRWRNLRFDQILQEDIQTLEPIRHLQSVKLLVDILRARVGGPIIISNIANDLQVAPNTVKHWIEILERMYVIFVVRPYTKGIVRAIQKPFKVYFFDNADVVGDEGAQFENLVATHLLKKLHFQEDFQGDRMNLCYIRDREGREVDFAIIRNQIVETLIEVKYADKNISSHLRYFAEKIQPTSAYQYVAKLDHPYTQGQLNVVSAIDHLSMEYPNFLTSK